MSESLADFDTFIFDEMMTHTVLFTHEQANNVAIINSRSLGVATETLKHHSVTNLWQINCQQNLADTLRVHHFSGNLQHIKQKFQVIIAFNPPNGCVLEDFYSYIDMLTPDGLLLHESASLFHVSEIKQTFRNMYHAGFHDLQVVHFPQPGLAMGWRAALLGSKQGTFGRIREKDIYNRHFSTRYYNFDMHKAALVLPEFIREELAL